MLDLQRESLTKDVGPETLSRLAAASYGDKRDQDQVHAIHRARVRCATSLARRTSIHPQPGDVSLRRTRCPPSHPYQGLGRSTALEHSSFRAFWHARRRGGNRGISVGQRTAAAAACSLRARRLRRASMSPPRVELVSREALLGPFLGDNGYAGRDFACGQLKSPALGNGAAHPLC